jgi:hypothetical protein
MLKENIQQQKIGVAVTEAIDLAVLHHPLTINYIHIKYGI